MKHKTFKITFFSFLAAISFSSAAQNKVNLEKSITKQQVIKFMKDNRSTLLSTYQCLNTDELSSCKVYCSSGGSKFIYSSHVEFAYYAERLNKLHGGLSGFFLIIDVKNNTEKKDLWATLQTESSCYFEGMTPVDLNN